MIGKRIFVGIAAALIMAGLIFSGIAEAGGGHRKKFQATARSNSGGVLASATIAVYLAGTSTAASVYTTATGTTAVNSVTANSQGLFTFYVDAFDYDMDQTFKIAITKTGHSSATLDNISVNDVVLGTYTLTEDTTVTTYTDIPEGVIYDGAYTLTFTHQPHIKGRYQVFGSSITVAGLTEAYPEWWGENTTPGTTDMTAEITAALAAVTNGIIRFQPEVYLVTPSSYTLFNPKANVTIEGVYGVSTIKIAASAGPYYGIFRDMSGSSNGTTDCSNFTIKNMVFDHNVSNNAVADADELTSYQRVTLGVYVGDDVQFINNIVQNNTSVNTVTINGSTVKRPVVRGNKFLDTGENSNDFFRDHSTIYIHTGSEGYISVQDNVFQAATDMWNDTAVTAIETHGSRQIVTGNIIYGYLFGMIITGYTRTDTEQSVISNNTIDVMQNGIILWSQQYDTHTTGYGFDGLIASNNHIRVRQTNLPESSGGSSGIMIYANSDLDVRRISVIGNDIVFDQQSATGYNDSSATGGITFYSTTAIRVEESAIQGNTVINCPGAGIQVRGVTVDVMNIKENNLINCGQSLDSTANYTYKIPIYFNPYQLEDAVFVENNMILDSNSTTLIENGMYFNATVDSSAAKTILSKNTISVTGSTVTAWDKPYLVGSANLKLYINNDTVYDFDAPGYACAAGSQVRETNTGYTRILKKDGTTWNIIAHVDDIPSSGSWTRGDVVYNNTPSILGDAGSRYTILGWLRITTGSDHVSGTDWAQLRCLTGT